MSGGHDPLAGFDPDGAGQVGGGIFGLPFSVEEASIVILPVPWEVTVSYRDGTAGGPQAVLDASPQLDLFDEELGDFWRVGIAMAEEDAWIRANNVSYRPVAREIIHFLETGGDPEQDQVMGHKLNNAGGAGLGLNRRVKKLSEELLNQGKQVILLGGDHSTPLGYLQALAERHPEFGILQVDAHLDLREAYEGFEFSHASIMFNALKLPQVKQLVQVGVRDFCKAEVDLAAGEGDRVQYWTGRQMAKLSFAGKSWADQVAEMIAPLPEKVYISFDIDGLEPWLCPHTGTPVPGGLNFEQAVYLLEAVQESGREIIGMDLVEVAPGPDGDEWDGNVGARLLYRMCAILSRQLSSSFSSP